MFDGDRARAAGSHRSDRGRAQGARGGDAGPHEEDPLAVRRPRRVEVLPTGILPRALLTRASGESGQPAGAHVHDPDAVRGAGHGVAAALGGERDPGAVRRPGRAAVVPGPVGELLQSGAVGSQRPEVEAAAPIGTDDEPAAVGRELRTGRFEAGRGERYGGAALPGNGPQHVLDLGDEPVTGGGEGGGTARGGGEGEGGRAGGGGHARCADGGERGGRGGGLEESAAGERTVREGAGGVFGVQGSSQCAELADRTGETTGGNVRRGTRSRAPRRRFSAVLRPRPGQKQQLGGDE